MENRDFGIGTALINNRLLDDTAAFVLKVARSDGLLGETMRLVRKEESIEFPLRSSICRLCFFLDFSYSSSFYNGYGGGNNY